MDVKNKIHENSGIVTPFIVKAMESLENSYEKCECCKGSFSSVRTLKEHRLNSECKEAVSNDSKISGGFKKNPSIDCEFLKLYGYCNQIYTTVREKNVDSKTIKKKNDLKDQLVCNCKHVNCPVCNSKHSDKRSMQRHLRHLHKWTGKDMEKLKHPCSVCNITFWTKSEMEDHVLNKHEKVPNCSICGVILKSKEYLKKHIDRTHEKKKKSTM